MESKELKQGDTIYYVDAFKIRHPKYFSVHPTGQGHYHILIDECQDPFRIHETSLNIFLQQGCTSYEDARLLLIKKFEEVISFHKKESKQ